MKSHSIKIQPHTSVSIQTTDINTRAVKVVGEANNSSSEVQTANLTFDDNELVGETVFDRHDPKGILSKGGLFLKMENVLL
ncbi:hypothetical protein BK708_02810 [Bacillus thuringiensis serovar yunnanensis]|nr:hypothetical protein BK708_02810 [Bacillus thuringiensis serovar yunnanensis]